MFGGKIDNSEQWKLEGNCDKCRKKEYCSKGCKAAKTRVRRIVAGVTEQVVREFFKKRG